MNEQNSPSFSQNVASGIEIKLVPAPLLRRIGAFILDLGIVSLVLQFAMIVLLIVGVLIFFLEKSVLNPSMPILTIIFAAIALIASMIGFHAYFVYYEERRGITPGKKVFGLQVINLEGHKMTRSQAIYRELARWYVDIFFLTIPALISILVTDRKQRIGDLISDTMVVYSRSKEQEKDYIYIAKSDFDLLSGLIKFKEIELNIMKKYCAFAFKYFIEPNVSLAKTSGQEWIDYLKSVIESDQSAGLDEQSYLLYFAEFCFQSTRHEQKMRVA